jgi:hypothetical protein
MTSMTCPRRATRLRQAVPALRGVAAWLVHAAALAAVPAPSGEPPLRLALESPASGAAAALRTPSNDEPTPTYRTLMPAATTLRYQVTRGMLSGTGDLAWRPQGERYELKLDFRIAGLAILSQASTGGFDAAGLAPLRFTDQRLRRAMTQADFQRADGRITYPGSTKAFALRAGAQDRLSWMVQLAAVVAADPALARPGARVVMEVTGSRADAGVWSFRCVGPDPVEVAGARVDAIKFVREPREPNDTTVQVWLDPQRQHLPVRATQRSGDEDAYELRLLEVLPGG